MQVLSLAKGVQKDEDAETSHQSEAPETSHQSPRGKDGDSKKDQMQLLPENIWPAVPRGKAHEDKAPRKNS